MFLSSWSIALTISSLIVFLLLMVAAKTAVRVLLFWDPARDDNRQIRLENEIWLSSTLVEYALGFQIVSLVLFVLAADSYGQVIVGAMCATGALLANDFGVWLLLLKIAGGFFYGFWIVLHQLDIRSETYPLVKVKYVYLLLLCAVVVADIVLQTAYIANLSPDIITSCCAVVFGEGQGESMDFIGGISEKGVVVFFYNFSLVLFVGQLVGIKKGWASLQVSAALGWLGYFVASLWAITTVFSSYVYSMPYHKCPFCILKPEYGYIGFMIYGSLIGACFWGIMPALLLPLKKNKSLLRSVASLQKIAVWLSLVFLALFVAATSFHLIRYLISGGEV